MVGVVLLIAGIVAVVCIVLGAGLRPGLYAAGFGVLGVGMVIFGAVDLYRAVANHREIMLIVGSASMVVSGTALGLQALTGWRKRRGSPG